MQTFLIDAAALDELRALLGPAQVLTADADRAPFEGEWTQRFSGQASVVLRPGNTQEVQAVVQWCRQHERTIVVQSGNTGTLGGAVPIDGEVVLCLGRLNRVRELDVDNATITVEAGVVLSQLQGAALDADLYFPLSLGAEGSCMIGGNLSTNAGGTAVLRYGNARDLTLGLEVVLPDGRIWNGLRGLRKDNAGYDLKQLFIGAEGTLGIITAATLKLYPRPRQSSTVLLAVESPSMVLALLRQLRRHCYAQLSGFEVFSAFCMDLGMLGLPARAVPLPGHPWYVLAQFDDSVAGDGLRGRVDAALAEALDSGLIRDAVVAKSDSEAQSLWQIRESIPIGKRRLGFSIAHDISLPASAIPQFLADMDVMLTAILPEVRIVAFGHWGDGNIHFDLLKPAAMSDEAARAFAGKLSDTVYREVMARRGSFSAEHGIGQGKKALLRRFKAPVEMDLMLKLKAALDPGGMLNPGKIF